MHPFRRISKNPRSNIVRFGNREIITQGLNSGFWTDLYHRSMSASWPVFFASAALVFIALYERKTSFTRPMRRTKGVVDLITEPRGLLHVGQKVVCGAVNSTHARPLARQLTVPLNLIAVDIARKGAGRPGRRISNQGTRVYQNLLP